MGVTANTRLQRAIGAAFLEKNWLAPLAAEAHCYAVVCW